MVPRPLTSQTTVAAIAPHRALSSTTLSTLEEYQLCYCLISLSSWYVWCDLVREKSGGNLVAPVICFCLNCPYRWETIPTKKLYILFVSFIVKVAHVCCSHHVTLSRTQPINCIFFFYQQVLYLCHGINILSILCHEVSWLILLLVPLTDVADRLLYYQEEVLGLWAPGVSCRQGRVSTWSHALSKIIVIVTCEQCQ